MGDFNVVRCESERKGSLFDKGKAEDFNNFINQANLLYLSLGRKKFTWIGQGGEKLSKFDRFLVSSELCDVWSGLSVLVLERVFSNHCPILLKNEVQDFGPTPFRFFNHWMEKDGFLLMIRKEWENFSIPGCASFVLKEKLKLLKYSIKGWINSNLSADLEKAKELRAKMEQWDREAELRELSSHEKEVFVTTRRDFFQAEKLVSQSLKQKSKVKWAVAGDENSSFFHGMVRGRLKRNTIKGLNVNR